MSRMRFVIALLSIVLGASVAAAGECRGALRPLLTQNPPNATALVGVRTLCRAEAEAGDADSMYQLALFFLGLGEWDVDAAIPLIRGAADAGVPEAQYWLAWQYEEGPLLVNDRERARFWYERASDNDHRLALSRLAAAYRYGELGLRADSRKAAEMRARAERCQNRSG